MCLVCPGENRLLLISWLTPPVAKGEIHTGILFKLVLMPVDELPEQTVVGAGVGAGLVRAQSVVAAFGPDDAPVVDMEQRAEVALHPEHHVATATPITAVGSTPGDELFSSKSDTTIAAITRIDRDSRLVNEHTKKRGARSEQPRSNVASS